MLKEKEISFVMILPGFYATPLKLVLNRPGFHDIFQLPIPNPFVAFIPLKRALCLFRNMSRWNLCYCVFVCLCCSVGSLCQFLPRRKTAAAVWELHGVCTNAPSVPVNQVRLSYTRD